MRNKIFGGIGILWGGAILANGLLGQTNQGSGAYQVGLTTALIFGGLMFAVGAYTFFKKAKLKSDESSEE